MSEWNLGPSFVMESAQPAWGILLLLTRFSAATRAVQLTWVTDWLLLDGYSVDGPLQTFLGKVEGHLRASAPRFLHPGCGSGGPRPSHVPPAKRCSVGQARPVSQATSCRMSFRISIGGTRGFFLPSLRLSFTTAASSSFFLLSTFARHGGF